MALYYIVLVEKGNVIDLMIKFNVAPGATLDFMDGISNTDVIQNLHLTYMQCTFRAMFVAQQGKKNVCGYQKVSISTKYILCHDTSKQSHISFKDVFKSAIPARRIYLIKPSYFKT